jgi:hypothetical protein
MELLHLRCVIAMDEELHFGRAVEKLKLADWRDFDSREGSY